MAFWNRNKKGSLHPPKGRELEHILTGSWEDFEAWIRATIGSEFSWNVRPRDTRANREMVVESISNAMKRNDGSFPKKDAFLERSGRGCQQGLGDVH